MKSSVDMKSSLMKSAFAMALVLAVASVAAPAPATKTGKKIGKKPARVLVVSVTKGYRHDSIPALEQLVGDIGSKSGAFSVRYVRTDQDLADLSPAVLAGYDGAVFASTTGDLPLPNREAFVSWVEAGHGFVGIHAATDTYPGFPGYIDMIGGQFLRHGKQVEVEAVVRDAKHPSSKGLAPTFKVFDEIYEFQKFDPARSHVVLGMDKHPQTGAAGTFPLAWTREPGKGRVFYTALGHREDVINTPWFRGHVEGGLRWVLKR